MMRHALSLLLLLLLLMITTDAVTSLDDDDSCIVLTVRCLSVVRAVMTQCRSDDTTSSVSKCPCTVFNDLSPPARFFLLPTPLPLTYRYWLDTFRQWTLHGRRVLYSFVAVACSAPPPAPPSSCKGLNTAASVHCIVNDHSPSLTFSTVLLGSTFISE